MLTHADRQSFRNEDLILRVSTNVNRERWDESLYEAFIEELCGHFYYQAGAILTTLRYLLGGEYVDLRALAKENYDKSATLEDRYGSWSGMQRHLQLPDQLSASLDLATGTGKSFVLYGLASILLAQGAVDRVLVLCPSTTIEDGLLDKFRKLAANDNLHKLLPPNSKVTVPRIINASQSITEGSICVDNYHAILEHVGSSIRDSLLGKGAITAVLNDEAHHVANESAAKIKKWKEFLVNRDYGFRYVIGVSGTCYVGNDYFADVIYRYSLRQAMEERYIKKVDYIAEMPRTGDPDEKWQLIYNRHEENRRKLENRKLLPLTIIVTPKIARCQEVAEELKGFLVDRVGLKEEAADEQVLVVFNNAPSVRKLPYIDSPSSKVQWIVSVSMLNEGWDVKRVFQIVPHEERAFNSKLLIAQVLGRGLRVPTDWDGDQPVVTVFNHDSWASSIRHLVNEILEYEKRLSSRVLEESQYHFELHNINYNLEPTSITKPMDRPYRMLDKGYVDLATDSPAEDVNIEFERAGTGERYVWQSKLQHKTYTPRQVALEMYQRLQEAQESDEPNEKQDTYYTALLPLERLELVVKASLKRIIATKATESMKQKFLQALGTLRRTKSENVRYQAVVNRYFTINTRQRQSDSVSAAELRQAKTFFFTDRTRDSLADEQVEFFDEVVEPGSGYKAVSVVNFYDFKTPLSSAIADSENEQRFIKMILQPANLKCYDVWIKSTATRFYEIDYAWKKGDHPKRGRFSPDFFVKIGNLVLVVEIKGDEELREPSEENRKKNEHALAHFLRLNEHLRDEGSAMRYKFTFLNDGYINKFSQSLRDGNIGSFRSELDRRLAEAD